MAQGSVSGNSSSSKSLMWMMVALFSGLALLLGAGVFFAGRVIKAVGLSAQGPKNAVHTASGTLLVEKEGQVGPGLPVYPRGAMVVPTSDDVKDDLQDSRNGIERVTYQTTDTRDLVDSWYEKHLSAEFTRHDAGEQPAPESVKSASVPAGDIAFVAERDQMARIVALSIDPNGTKITLIRIDKPAAP